MHDYYGSLFMSPFIFSVYFSVNLITKLNYSLFIKVPFLCICFTRDSCLFVLVINLQSPQLVLIFNSFS